MEGVWAEMVALLDRQSLQKVFKIVTNSSKFYNLYAATKRFCPSYIFFARHQRDTWTLFSRRHVIWCESVSAGVQCQQRPSPPPSPWIKHS